MSNNPSGGIYTQVTENARSRWRIINTTIYNPNSFEGGVDGLTLDQGLINFDLTNSINWGNDLYSFNFNFLNNVFVKAFHSNVEMQNPDMVNDMVLESSINEDPLFIDSPNGDFSLRSESACIDNGVDVGLPYLGEAPDMGAFEFDLNSTTIIEQSNATIVLSPNPVREQLLIDFENQDNPINTIELFTLGGLLVDRLNYKNVSNKIIDFSNYAPGLYLLQVHSGQDLINRIVVKQ